MVEGTRRADANDDRCVGVNASILDRVADAAQSARRGRAGQIMVAAVLWRYVIGLVDDTEITSMGMHLQVFSSFEGRSSS